MNEIATTPDVIHYIDATDTQLWDTLYTICEREIGFWAGHQVITFTIDHFDFIAPDIVGLNSSQRHDVLASVWSAVCSAIDPDTRDASEMLTLISKEYVANYIAGIVGA